MNKLSRTGTYTRIFVLLITIQLFWTEAFSQTTINVNVNDQLNDVSPKSLGINMNYLMDGSYISPAPVTSTQNAIMNTGTKFLRFPGGEKSDNYLWSVPPYTSSNPHFARTGSCEWPANDSRFAMSDNATVKPSGLDFDEFMTMCQSVGGEPLIVVPYDAMYKPIPNGCTGTVPTKAQLLTNAEEWVRYANIVKGYNIKYWMIGNESYNTSAANGYATAAQYRDDIVLFSQRMKAVDPSIKIIANGDKASWWQVVLASAAHFDFLGISNYPVWQYTGGYTYYKNNTPNFIGPVDVAVNAVNAYAPAAHKSRLKIISTETNTMDWAGAWANSNDLGHAMACFELLGEHLKNPKVESALLWNTRWINNVTQPYDIYDAFDKNGSLQANGKALSIWGKNMLTKIVNTTSTTTIRTFATYDPLSQSLNVFVVNKELTSQNITLNALNYIRMSTIERWDLKGSGPADTNPSWTKGANESIRGTTKGFTLAPVSITLLKFRKPVIIPIAVNVNFTFNKVQVTSNMNENQIAGRLVVERSVDGINFSYAGIMEAEKNKKDGTVEYLFTDEAGSQKYYYRVKSEDNSDLVSDIIPAEALKPVSLNIYPNPATHHATVDLGTNILSMVKVEAYQPDGKRVYISSSLPADGKIPLEMTGWSAGIYIIRVTVEDETHTMKLFVQ